MASMRDIDRRRKSVQSTGQITKAMKLVSTVKLQKARSRAENAKPYFNYMYATVKSILGKSGYINHHFLRPSGSEKKAVILMTSNRGLAGGYNNNVAKLVSEDERFNREDTLIYALGIKGRENLFRKGYIIAEDASDVMNEPLFSDAKALGDKLLDLFSKGEIGEIYIAYTVFKNTVSQIPTVVKLLPIDKEELSDNDTDDSAAPMNFEPEETDALDMIIPKYVNSLIYGALMESVASENGARMSAMDSATSNANDLIEKLSLKYNRARQSSITQELTEIVAGAEAIS